MGHRKCTVPGAARSQAGGRPRRRQGELSESKQLGGASVREGQWKVGRAKRKKGTPSDGMQGMSGCCVGGD